MLMQSKIRMPMEDPNAQHSYEVPADAVSSLGEQAVQQTATSGRPPAMLRTRVHTLNDPSTALQPLSREEFVAKLPKVYIKWAFVCFTFLPLLCFCVAQCSACHQYWHSLVL